ncbi:uncharacterized protein L201_006104 [Kwoniella dendrophila CBS 6074]|uniref:F-box domain-containing protein n=1 Tax=Kwoniella dendrophila CBS 6074 TaxID=1295534 RepID=A0AAX4K1Y1_9TREE
MSSPTDGNTHQKSANSPRYPTCLLPIKTKINAMLGNNQTSACQSVLYIDHLCDMILQHLDRRDVKKLSLVNSAFFRSATKIRFHTVEDSGLEHFLASTVVCQASLTFDFDNSLEIRFKSTTAHITVDHLRHERKVWNIIARKLGRSLATLKFSDPCDSPRYTGSIQIDFEARDRIRQKAVYTFLNKTYQISCAIAKGSLSLATGESMMDEALNTAKPSLKQS